MPTKGNTTKQFILYNAKKLFALNGFSKITMSDVCKACDMSRGGVYRYFGSTKDIMSEILKEDKNEKGFELNKCFEEGMPAVKILEGFFEDRKKTLIFGEFKGFSFAVQEYSNQENYQLIEMKERLHQAVLSLSSLFEYGQKRKEFKEFDIYSMALTTILLLDSLELNTHLFNSSDDVDKQIIFLVSNITK